MEKEIDFTQGKPDGAGVISNAGAQAVVQHFGSDGLSALEESPEAIASELCTLRERMKVDEAREKKLVSYFKAKKDRGAQMYGSCMVEVKEEKGRTTVDWKGYITSEIGAEAISEAERAYGKVGDPIIKVSVKRIGSGQQG